LRQYGTVNSLDAMLQLVLSKLHASDFQEALTKQGIHSEIDDIIINVRLTLRFITLLIINN
jgi:hypothetical protein